MSSEADRIRFLGEPTRLKVAGLCRDQWLTRGEIAGMLGREAGSLSQPTTMVKRGALEMKPRKKGSDGRDSTVFKLKVAWRSALDEARARGAPMWPAREQDLLVIPLQDVPEACAILAKGVPGIEWGARVSGARGGLGGLILAPSLDADGANTVRVVAALGGSTPGLVRLQLGQVMGEAELRGWSTRVSGGTGELPAGS